MQKTLKATKIFYGLLMENIFFNNIRENTKAKIYFPFPHEDGEIEYMGKKYKLKEIKF